MRQSIRRGMRLVLFVLALFAFWLMLSGQYPPWFTVSGLVFAVAVAGFSYANRFVDGEAFPVGLLPRALVYWPWLVVEIIKSALRVARIILDPRLPISPRMARVAALQKTGAGLTTYANSITLTPGTVTVEANEGSATLWVHALERSSAEGFADDEMNRRVAWLEGSRRDETGRDAPRFDKGAQ